MTIRDRVQRLLSELPEGMELVVAGKTRTPDELMEVVENGARIIGENYVQEAEKARAVIGDRVKWHFIGHLQKNKVRKAVRIFDLIETVDSAELASEISRRSIQAGKTMTVLVQVNIGREPQKSGVPPEGVEPLLNEISALPNIRVLGLMAIEPLSDNPECSRPYFAQMKALFDCLGRLDLPNVEMKYLSMGMTRSYRVAIEEGANIVRIGSWIFTRGSLPHSV